MTELGYDETTMVRGRKPADELTGLPKKMYAVRLPVDVITFLQSRENQAEWLTEVVRKHPEYRTGRRETK
jgi:hypothetical protein